MATIDPQSFLHLVAVLFAGVEKDGDPLLVDEATLRACFDNRRLLANTTFTKEAFAKDPAAPEEARDGTNAQTFADLLDGFGRDEDFRELTVRVLRMLDELRDVLDSRDQRETQPVDEGDLKNRLEKEGLSDERWEVFESSPWRDGVRAYAKYALNLVWPKDEEEILKAWDDLGENRGDAWKTIARIPGAYAADNPRGSVKDDLARKEAGATVADVRTAKIELTAEDDPDAHPDGAPPGGARQAASVGSDAVIRIPAPPLPERFLAEVERQKAERRAHEAQARAELVTLEQRSQYLVLLLEVTIRIAFALPDGDVLTELKRLRPLIRRGATFRRRVVDGLVYELNNPSWGQADSFFAQMINGGYPVRSMREDIGAPESDVAYLLETFTDRGLDPETVNVNLLREREETERARLEAERRAEEARLEAERLAEEARIEAERLEAEKVATEAAAKAAAPPPPTP